MTQNLICKAKNKVFPFAHALGIDIGGHGIKAVILSPTQKVLATAQRHLESPAERSLAQVEEHLRSIVEELTAAPGISALATPVGISIPGLLRPSDGFLQTSPNFPGWSNLNIAEHLGLVLERPVYIENDANCALLGEVHAGAAYGCQDVILLTLGTGVGTAFMINGRLLRGGSATGAEGGHIIFYKNGHLCGCGQKGCLETAISGPALSRHAEDLARKNNVDWPSPAAKEVFGMAQQATGPKSLVARRAIAEWSKDLASGIAMFLHLFGSDRVVLCGGLSLALPQYRTNLIKALKRRTLSGCQSPELTVVGGNLGTLSGAVGAATLVQKGEF